MSESKKVENVIREYLLEETTIKKISEAKLDFGIQFKFPHGSDTSGRPIGQNMAVFKPQGKELLIISLGTQVSEPHQKALDSLEEEKKMRFFVDLRKLFLIKNLMFRIDIQNVRYEISEPIFLSPKKVPSKNTFFKNVRKVFSCAAYCQILLNEYCSGKVGKEDLGKTRDFTGPGFSLYS